MVRGHLGSVQDRQVPRAGREKLKSDLLKRRRHNFLASVGHDANTGVENAGVDKVWKAVRIKHYQVSAN